MSETVLVAASLVRYLRRGIRAQFGFAAERLAVCLLEFDEEPVAEVERSLRIFDAARDLHGQLKAMGDSPSSSIEIDVASNAVLVLTALEAQYNTEVVRLEEADIRLRQAGLPAGQNSNDIRALEDLIAVVKRHVKRQGADNTELFPVPPVPRARTTLTGSRPPR